MSIINKFIAKIVGSRNERLIKKLHKTVEQINDLESGLGALSDEELSAKTQVFKDRLNNQETLDSLLVEAFAVMREASKRARLLASLITAKASTNKESSVSWLLSRSLKTWVFALNSSSLNAPKPDSRSLICSTVL